MAISATHYMILRELKQRGVLPQGGSILEIGQANWYGDAPPSIVDPGLPNDTDSFQVARRLYEILCEPWSVLSIDLDPAAPGALRLDLNKFEDSVEPEHDLVVNHGTAEHVFNIANVFRLMHEATKPGGLMIHEAPFTGWVDHGFYCLQPTLFWDVAAANGYEMVGVWGEHLASRSYFAIESREALLERRRCDQLPDNAMLFVAMRKGAEDAPFRVPMQGVYAGQVSTEAISAWKELR
jgi:hypothetical protein